METARIGLPTKLIPVFAGDADVRGAYGGRGSAKTRSFAKMAAVRGYMFGMAGVRGIILCARQYMNSLDDSSLEEVKRAIEDEPFDSVMSETILIVYGKVVSSGSAPSSARRASAPCPISRRPGLPKRPVSPTE